MSRTKPLFFAAAAFTVLVASTAGAQSEDQDWSGPASAPYAQHYDPHMITIFDGVITAVDRFTPAKGTSRGLLLKVLLADGTVRTVHLGPEWFVSESGFKFAKKDHITVTGARATIAKKPVVIAAKVELGDRLLVLRDARGVPLWRGFRRSLPPAI